MPDPLHDALGAVAADGHPGDRAGAEIVEAEVDTGVVGNVELRSFHARELHVNAEIFREVALAGEGWKDAPAPAALPVHRSEQRQEVRLDAEGARLLVLHDLGFGAVVGVLAVDGAMDRDLAVLEVDVLPFERFKLARAPTEVDRGGLEAAPEERCGLPLNEALMFAGIDEDLRALGAAVRPFDAGCGIILSDTKRLDLRPAGIAKRARDNAPDVDGRFPTKLAAVHVVVQVFH